MPNPFTCAKIVSVLQPDDVVLDVGCGNKRYFRVLQPNCAKYITVDIWDKMHPDILMDVTKMPLPLTDKSVDVVLLLDFIEHLSRDDGETFLVEVERVCKRCMILLTPLLWDRNEKNVLNPGFWSYGNPANLHRSLWNLEDFKDWERWDIQDRKDYFIGVNYL
jgi:SAM-dependent methyltransferase